jgi:hypothetical protein
MSYLEMALKVKPQNKSRGDSSTLIEQTLLEINQAYPEVRDRMKDSPQWKAFSEIEREINKTVLEDDFEGLGKALEAYKQAVVTVEDTGSQGNLFQGTQDDAGRTKEGVGHENSQDDPD